jgi:hypothetical protein
MTVDTPAEPRYKRFTVTYPSGTTFESYYLIEGGGALGAVQVEHPLGVVEAVEASRVPTPGED